MDAGNYLDLEQVLKILEWMLWKTSLKWTLVPLSLTLPLLQTLSFRLALRMSISKTMPLLNLLRTLEMTPLSEF